MNRDGIEVKYGLWENGRRIKWFTREEVIKIEQGDEKYKESLKDKGSVEVIEKETRFSPPRYFKFKSAILK